MSMPMSWAASRSCAVARIALPSFVLWMKRVKAMTNGTVTTNTKTSLVVTRTKLSIPNAFTRSIWGMYRGKLIGETPFQ